MALREWATKELNRGDLTSLAEIAGGRRGLADKERLQRLLDRGFIIEHEEGVRITASGRMALLVRKITKNALFQP